MNRNGLFQDRVGSIWDRSSVNRASVVVKCGALGALAGCWVCDSTKLSVDEVKNLRCCLVGQHVKCSNVSIKQQ